jgi:hypothetical protein
VLQQHYAGLVDDLQLATLTLIFAHFLRENLHNDSAFRA